MARLIEKHSSRTGTVLVSASFDDIRSADVRFLQDAARLGPVHVRLWSDDLVASRRGSPPAFPAAERRFVVAALRYVAGVSIVGSGESVVQPLAGADPAALVVRGGDDDPELRAECLRLGIEYVVSDRTDSTAFVDTDLGDPVPNARRVVVTGCYDWLHSGHIEFYREAATHGELYVVVGSDRNVRLLKGDGHPLHGQDERRFMVQSVRTVHRAMISSGSGWMDAEPEIATILPHVYIVNDDGDQPEKREFCRARGIEYVVLRRRPHRGLRRRTSTDLRGY